MDRKLIPIVAALMFFGYLVALQGVFGQTDVVTIDYPQHHKTDKYKGTQFPHKKHADAVKPCQMCHHKWYKGEKVKKCVDCHTKDSTITAYKAFHDNCKNCHMDIKKAGKATGPTVCTKCHPKK